MLVYESLVCFRLQCREYKAQKAFSLICKVPQLWQDFGKEESEWNKYLSINPKRCVYVYCFMNVVIVIHNL